MSPCPHQINGLSGLPLKVRLPSHFRELKGQREAYRTTQESPSEGCKGPSLPG